jgi:sporulation protein YlmC with PRC-barrel domain
VRVIVNPVTETTTHFTVRPTGMAESEHVVPFAAISAGSAEFTELNVSRNQFYLYPLFESHHFLDMEEAGLTPEIVKALPEAHRAMEHVFWPFVTAEGYLGTYASVPQIPADQLAINRGAPVEATNGHVGQVSALAIDPETAHVTHLVLRKDQLFGHRDIAVPINDLDRLDEGIVYLKIDKSTLNDLPDLDIER